MFLKRTLVAGALVVGTAFSAAAADLPPMAPAPPPPPPPMAAPAFDWSGMYFGLYGGAIFDTGATIFEAGAQAGFNVVRGRFLAGIEAQIGAAFATGAVIADAALNGRLGFILGERVLLYGEAGVGVLTDFSAAIAYYTAGGGLEFAVGQRASLFGEAKVLGTFAGGCCAYVVQGGVNIHR